MYRKGLSVRAVWSVFSRSFQVSLLIKPPVQFSVSSSNPQAVFWRARCRLAIGDHASLGDDAAYLMRSPETEPLGLELRAEGSLRSGRYSDAVYDALYLKKKFPSNQRAEAILEEARVKALQQFKEGQRK